MLKLSDSPSACNAHQFMFIRDVTTALEEGNMFDKRQFRTVHNRIFQRVRLNGIVVTQLSDKQGEAKGPFFWLDDGTDTIQVFVAPQLQRRIRQWHIKISTSVTVLGTPDVIQGRKVVVCNIIRENEDLVVEMHHCLRAIQNQKECLTQVQVAKGVEENEKEGIKKTLYNKDSALLALDTPFGKIQCQFQSLCSQPSPERLPMAILKTPERVSQEIEDEGGWQLSPEHPMASSTPIRPEKQKLGSQPPRPSPLRDYYKPPRPLIGDEDDSFDNTIDSVFDKLDFDALEQEALKSSQLGKRDFSQYEREHVS